MKTPEFWQEKNWASTALLPAAAIYGAAAALHWKLREAAAVSLEKPVICIGNLTAGGGGKTPLALLVGRMLRQKNINAYFLSRGYGGLATEPTLVNRHLHSATEVGDEPLLLAEILPTVVAKNRLAGAKFAIAQGAEAIVTDDGFQNPSLKKNLSLLAIDGGYGLGNGRLLPAGPLRQTPSSGFARADAVVIIGRCRHKLDIPPSLPVLPAALVADAEAAAAIKGKKILAFCGIARPQKFFDTVADIGADVVDVVAFPDHHFYRDRDIGSLAAAARRAGARLVTTAKDAVRLLPEWRPLVTVIPVSLQLEKPEALDSLLSRINS